MRIDIDPNVLLSGLLMRGAPHTLFNQPRVDSVKLAMSKEKSTCFNEAGGGWHFYFKR